ncbi:MAG TPA: JAB domain-containing protein [Candidatus Saccharimonadales bacterium]|nr:JAB domain-containing protein [Candidatus Saccharimonadales bacterium]
MDRSKPLYKTEDILPHLNFIRKKKQEYLVCLSLDANMRLIRKRVVTIGLLDRTLIHPREVFAGPLQDRAKFVVVAHNHPSGDPEPSQHDITMTQHLVAAGQLLGVKLQDHLTVSGSSYFSFRSASMIL